MKQSEVNFSFGDGLQQKYIINISENQQFTRGGKGQFNSLQRESGIFAPNEMRICIVRHGVTDWNVLQRIQGREDIPLNEDGIKQIEILSTYLARFRWAAIITSPLKRAKDSAAIINDKVGTNIFLEPDFAERDFGDASGMTVDEREKLFPDGNYTGMETKEIFSTRLVNALNRYIDAFKSDDIIVVSHGAAIDELLANLQFKSGEYVNGYLRNACVCLIEHNNDEFDLIYYNKLVDELE